MADNQDVLIARIGERLEELTEMVREGSARHAAEIRRLRQEADFANGDKHDAQADAERHKAVADQLRDRLQVASNIIRSLLARREGAIDAANVFLDDKDAG